MRKTSRNPKASRNLAGWLGVPAACVVSMAVLLLSFAPFNAWPLAYVALIPWTLAMVWAPRRWFALLCAYAGGLFFWMVGLYWIWFVDLVGFFALVVFLALYMLAAGAVVGPAIRRGLPAVAVLPVVWISLEFIRLYALSGFPWFVLSHSQYGNTMLIQAVDWMGELGPGLLVAMVNGAGVDALLAWRRRGTGGLSVLRPILGGVACIVVAVGMLTYGWFRLAESAGVLRDGPVVAVVQHAYPIYINAVPSAESSPEAMFRRHLESTRSLAGTGVELVVWPESMGPTLLGREFLEMDFAKLTPHERRAVAAAVAGPSAWKADISDGVIDDYLLRLRDGEAGVRDFARELAAVSGELNAALLVGSLTLHRNDLPLDGRDLYVRRNSVVLVDGGPTPVGEYSKKHLVPFGEYVPFKHGWRGLHKFLRSFVPPEMPQLDPGREKTILHCKDVRVAAPICYEGVIARLCRSLVMADGDKRSDMIVNQSNDGWFVHRDATGRWRGTTEQSQHLSQYVFRAVENRVPVVRAVNTGISAYVDSTGRIRATVERGGENVMVSGTLVLDGSDAPGHGPRVQLDGRVSPYSRWGNVFPWVMLAAGGVLTVYLILSARREKRRAKQTR